jgi:hypothetical protein
MVNDLLIKKKFLDHREWNVNEASRDFESTERWMEMRVKYGREVLIPFAIKHNIIRYPDENDHRHVDFTAME